MLKSDSDRGRPVVVTAGVFSSWMAVVVTVVVTAVVSAAASVLDVLFFTTSLPKDVLRRWLS